MELFFKNKGFIIIIVIFKIRILYSLPGHRNVQYLLFLPVLTQNYLSLPISVEDNIYAKWLSTTDYNQIKRTNSKFNSKLL